MGEGEEVEEGVIVEVRKFAGRLEAAESGVSLAGVGGEVEVMEESSVPVAFPAMPASNPSLVEGGSGVEDGRSGVGVGVGEGGSIGRGTRVASTVGTPDVDCTGIGVAVERGGPGPGVDSIWDAESLSPGMGVGGAETRLTGTFSRATAKRPSLSALVLILSHGASTTESCSSQELSSWFSHSTVSENGSPMAAVRCRSSRRTETVTGSALAEGQGSPLESKAPNRNARIGAEKLSCHSAGMREGCSSYRIRIPCDATSRLKVTATEPLPRSVLTDDGASAGGVDEGGTVGRSVLSGATADPWSNQLR